MEDVRCGARFLAGTKFSLKLLLYSDDIPIITELISSLCMVLSLNDNYVLKFKIFICHKFLFFSFHKIP